MRDRAGDADFAVKLREALGIARNAIGQELERDGLFELQILSAVDLADAAAAERRDDPEAAGEQRARRQPSPVAPALRQQQHQHVLGRRPAAAAAGRRRQRHAVLGDARVSLRARCPPAARPRPDRHRRPQGAGRDARRCAGAKAVRQRGSHRPPPGVPAGDSGQHARAGNRRYLRAHGALRAGRARAGGGRHAEAVRDGRAVRAAVVPRDESDGPGRGRSGRAGTGGAPRGRGDRPGAARLRGEDDGGGGGRVALGPPVRAPVAGTVRRRGAGARGRRRVRRHELRRRAADEGDRHPNGARRGAARGVAAGRRRRHAPGCLRNRDRLRARGRPVARAARDALRRQLVRPDRLRRPDTGARRSSASRCVRSRAHVQRKRAPLPSRAQAKTQPRRGISRGRAPNRARGRARDRIGRPPTPSIARA